MFLVEPIQGKGVHLPPPGYLESGAGALPHATARCFCVDEVQTGFGRTGRLFAFEHWGLEPDLVPIAKSLSGGYVPVGALLMSKAVHERVFDSMEHAFSHGSTFAPNELAMAAGLATLHELDDGRARRRARRTLGARLLELTLPLVERYDVVREVRGLGLMWAIEFGEPAARRPLLPAHRAAAAGHLRPVRRRPALREHRILSQVAGHGIPVIKALPSLTIDEDDLAWFADSLDQTVRRARRVPRAAGGFALTASRPALRRRAPFRRRRTGVA